VRFVILNDLYVGISKVFIIYGIFEFVLFILKCLLDIQSFEHGYSVFILLCPLSKFF
jgi:hypothetical protein